MDAQDFPSNGLLVRVPLRSNSILMAAVRSGNYRELDARRRSSRLRELMYVHLKKDLEVRPVTWRKAGLPAAVPEELGRDGMTGYGVPKAVQAQLAAIRTDLDAFSETESTGLMLSGYLMTAKESAGLDTIAPALVGPASGSGASGRSSASSTRGRDPRGATPDCSRSSRRSGR